MLENNTGEQNVRSITRTFNLLEIISDSAEGYSISDLAKKSGMSKSTVHRLLQTLKDLNYIQQDPSTEKYFLGYKILSLCSNTLANLDVKYVANKYLIDLRNKVNETVHLVVRDGLNAVYVDKWDGNLALCMYSEIGRTIPLYCSSAGKALIAWNSENFIRDLYKDYTFQKFTETTITNLDDLLLELEKTKKQGYALDLYEHEDLVVCMGSPIFDYNNKVIASVSVSGTVLTFNEEHFKYSCEQVNDTAKRISTEMGCISYPATFNFSPCKLAYYPSLNTENKI